ncbi:hypothetical protein OKJ48_33350 [Streptomyces kunmingensis]|uniref:Uncharacterized protein n=1 Tax=Streptomyces kunmingensis TaxID=68225 RepID=A0ABU6CK34_9ACTN|nr:hypothetical protein [Streptomyces kunmingensis]MEB3965079.1 hypothetical protein [Streptomyces kunmingensis]
MNLDRRADYVLQYSAQNNVLYGWRNLGGLDNQWSEKKKIAYGVAMDFPVEMHLADLSGDLTLPGIQATSKSAAAGSPGSRRPLQGESSAKRAHRSASGRSLPSPGSTPRNLLLPEADLGVGGVVTALPPLETAPLERHPDMVGRSLIHLVGVNLAATSTRASMTDWTPGGTTHPRPNQNIPARGPRARSMNELGNRVIETFRNRRRLRKHKTFGCLTFVSAEPADSRTPSAGEEPPRNVTRGQQRPVYGGFRFDPPGRRYARNVKTGSVA